MYPRIPHSPVGVYKTVNSCPIHGLQLSMLLSIYPQNSDSQQRYNILSGNFLKLARMQSLLPSNVHCVGRGRLDPQPFGPKLSREKLSVLPVTSEADVIFSYLCQRLASELRLTTSDSHMIFSSLNFKQRTLARAWQHTRFYQYSTVLWPKRGSNVIRF